MYFVTDAKLAITDESGTHEKEIPAGAPPIFPSGWHQVKNIGDTEAKVFRLFLHLEY